MKGQEPEKPPNHERWIISYADFTTLLLATFVVMYAVSTINSSKFQQMAESFSTAFIGRTTHVQDTGFAAAQRAPFTAMPNPVHVPIITREVQIKNLPPALRQNEVYGDPSEKSEDGKIPERWRGDAAPTAIGGTAASAGSGSGASAGRASFQPRLPLGLDAVRGNLAVPRPRPPPAHPAGSTNGRAPTHIFGNTQLLDVEHLVPGRGRRHSAPRGAAGKGGVIATGGSGPMGVTAGNAPDGSVGRVVDGSGIAGAAAGRAGLSVSSYRALLGRKQADLSPRDFVQQLLRQGRVLTRLISPQMGHPLVRGRLDYLGVALEQP